VRGQRHVPPAPYPRDRPGTHCTLGWVGRRTGLDRCGKSRLTGIRSPDCPARRHSLYRLRYPAHSVLFIFTFFWYIINCFRMIILRLLLFSFLGVVRVYGIYVINHHCHLLLLCTCSDTFFSFLRAHKSRNNLFGLLLPPWKAIVAQVIKNLPCLMEAKGSLPCKLWHKELDSLWHMGH